MKTLTQLKNKITVTLLALACAFTAQTATAAVHDMKSNDYIRVTIPEASLADSRLIYAIDGQKIEAFPSHGEVVTFHAEKDDFLAKLYFSAQAESADSFRFEMTGTDPVGADHFVKFKSTGEQAQYDGDTSIYVNAVGATVEVIPVGGLDVIVPEVPSPILIGEESQDFSKVGMLEMRFVVKSAEAPDGDGDANDGGNDDGGELPEGQPASGGCAMVAGVDGGSALNLAGFAAAAALSLALRRRAARK